MPKCEDCKSVFINVISEYECHRYPPSGLLEIPRRFPCVHPIEDWCDEFKSKERIERIMPDSCFDTSLDYNEMLLALTTPKVSLSPEYFLEIKTIQGMIYKLAVIKFQDEFLYAYVSNDKKWVAMIKLDFLVNDAKDYGYGHMELGELKNDRMFVRWVEGDVK